MKYRTLISPVASLLLLGACSLDLKNIGTPDESGGSVSSTGDTTGDATDTTDGTGTDGATDPILTGATESTGAPDEPPAACNESDPSVSADLEVIVDGVPGDHKIALPCVVDAVTTEGQTSVTALTCDDDGTPHAVTVRLAVSPEGPVAWGPGDPVTLDSVYENLDVYTEARFELRGADDALLAAGYFPRVGGLIPGTFDPISVQAVTACGPVGDLDVHSYRLDFELADLPPVSVFSGHRGVLVIDDDERFAIDIGRAIYNDCCHYDENFELLVRRVKTG